MAKNITISDSFKLNITRVEIVGDLTDANGDAVDSGKTRVVFDEESINETFVIPADALAGAILPQEQE